MSEVLNIRSAIIDDIPQILAFIKELADYEKLSHEVVADETVLRQSLFGENKTAEVLIGEHQKQAVAFALFFHNFSTFLGRPGIYLEDLYVSPTARGKGFGKAMLSYLAKLAVARNCGRLEWSVLDWNKPAIDFYESLNAKPQNEWITYRLTGEELLAAAETTTARCFD